MPEPLIQHHVGAFSKTYAAARRTAEEWLWATNSILACPKKKPARSRLPLCLPKDPSALLAGDRGCLASMDHTRDPRNCATNERKNSRVIPPQPRNRHALHRLPYSRAHAYTHIRAYAYAYTHTPAYVCTHHGLFCLQLSCLF